jgi:large subunit ribosomal protein L21
VYAIVKTGGKQYRVEEGQTLLVERLPADEGATVKLEPLLYRSDDAVFDRDGLGKVNVSARVVGHVRGPKLRVFKFKPKRGYRRTTGHRQELTRLEVTTIEGPGGAPKRSRAAKAEPSAKADSAARPEPAAKPKAEAKSEEKPTGTQRARAARAKPPAAGEKDEPTKPKAPRSSGRSRPAKEEKPDGT